jgi:hypothetical protein
MLEISVTFAAFVPVASLAENEAGRRASRDGRVSRLHVVHVPMMMITSHVQDFLSLCDLILDSARIFWAMEEPSKYALHAAAREGKSMVVNVDQDASANFGISIASVVESLLNVSALIVLLSHGLLLT